MSEPVSERIQRTLARIAEQAQQGQTDSDSDAARQRLAEASDDELRRVAYDRNESQAARGQAILILISRLQRERTLTDILLPLWDDPDETLAKMAIQYVPPFDPRATELLRKLLDDPQPHRWSTAAMTLARRNDESIVRRLLAWFRKGDKAHRNVARICLPWLLDEDARLKVLRQAWKEGGCDEEDRAMLATGLLDLGDRAGLSFLVELARRADGDRAVWAAEMVKMYEPALGLELMMGILDHGTTEELRCGMVERIARHAGLPHVWPTDELAEARHWIRQEQERIAQSPAPTPPELE